jgi:alkylation response protein AidB-like acyl-CoA dehydrogenase
VSSPDLQDRRDPVPLREVKVMQIFEGTNQIQRMVIGRHLTSDQAKR